MANSSSSTSSRSCSNDIQDQDRRWSVIASRAVGLADFEVIFFDKSIMKQLEDDCLKEELVGLTCIRLKHDNDLLMCLTTSDRIYAFRLNIEVHSKCFVKILKKFEKYLKFYIYQGATVSHYLAKHFEIDLPKYEPIDLVALDIYLSSREYTLSGAAAPDHYTVENLVERVEKRDISELVEKYLAIKNVPTLITAEREALKRQPFDDMAKNAIKLRAGFTRQIGLEMHMREIKFQFQEMNNLYSFPIRATPDELEAYDQTNDNTYDTLMTHLAQTHDTSDIQVTRALPKSV